MSSSSATNAIGQHAAEHLVRNPIWIIMWGSTEESDLFVVTGRDVRNPVLLNPIWRSTEEPTLATNWNPSAVIGRAATEPSHRNLTLRIIFDSTRGSAPSPARGSIVRKHSRGSNNSKSTWGPTRGNGLTSVPFVQPHSQHGRVWSRTPGECILNWRNCCAIMSKKEGNLVQISPEGFLQKSAIVGTFFYLLGSSNFSFLQVTAIRPLNWINCIALSKSLYIFSLEIISEIKLNDSMIDWQRGSKTFLFHLKRKAGTKNPSIISRSLV